jgi:hypothetical protein
VLILHHFAEYTARLGVRSLSFQRFPNGPRLAWLSCVGIQPKRENDNGANGNVRDCLAESETTSTPATLGADQSEFREDSLCGSGTCFHFSWIILDRYVELGNHCWRSRRLALFQDLKPRKSELNGAASAVRKRTSAARRTLCRPAKCPPVPSLIH